MNNKDENFKGLIDSISTVHFQLQQNAINAINQSLTIRNWLIGYYIVEFEQQGEDRAQYGRQLIPKLAKELKELSGIDENLFVQQYLVQLPSKEQLEQHIINELRKLG